MAWGLRRYLTVLTCVILASIAGACTKATTLTGQNQTNSPTGAGSTTTSVEVFNELLAVSDLPTGWAEIPAPSDQAVTCDTQPFAPAGPVATARQYFAMNGNVPLLQEVIASFTNGSQAFTKVKSDLDACQSFDATSGGQTVHETQGEMSFPQSGNESAAWTVTFNTPASAGDLSVVGDYVVAQKGNQLVAIGYADIGSVDTDQLQTFVSSALAKMPAG